MIYFYPKDDTPGCTAQACALRDSYEHLIATGAMVVGVSIDPPESHVKFIAKHILPFPLISDDRQEIVLGTDPRDPASPGPGGDIDGDGLPDADEVNVHGSSARGAIPPHFAQQFCSRNDAVPMLEEIAK